MMVEVMFKNWGLDRQPKETVQDRGGLDVILQDLQLREVRKQSQGRQKQSPRDYHPTGRPGKQSSRQLAFSGSFLSEGPHGRGAKAAVGTQRRFC